MRQETINIYTFNELSEGAKEKARAWFREGGTSDDFEFVIEDAQRMGELLGIEFKEHWGGASIFWSGFCSQGDGASFAGTYRYRTGALKALMAESPAQWTDAQGVVYQCRGNAELHRIARELQQAQAAHFYQIVTRVTQGGHYCHENTMSFDHERADGKELNDDCRQIEDALRDFARWIYSQLETEWEFQNSDERVDESIIANEYEFYEGGKRA